MTEVGVFTSRKKSKKRISCSVYGCDSSFQKNVDLTFHCFPKKYARCVYKKNDFGEMERLDQSEAWRKALSIVGEINSHMKVCSLHFEKEDYILPNISSQKRRLKSTAIPSCNLSHSSIDSRENQTGETERERTLKGRHGRKESSEQSESYHPQIETVLENMNRNEGNHHSVEDEMVADDFDSQAAIKSFTNIGAQVKSDYLRPSYTMVIENNKQVKMLTLILETQEGHQIELNVQPEDTFEDLKNQYADHEFLGLSDSLQQLITNGASVAENTKIFDFITRTAQEWCSMDTSAEPLPAHFPETAVEFRTCCAHGCSNTEETMPEKPFRPLPTDHDRLYVCLSEIGRLDLYNGIFGTDGEQSQTYFLCDSHFSQGSSLLPVDVPAEPTTTLSLLKPKNDRPRTCVIDEEIKLTKEAKEEEEIREEGEENGVASVNELRKVSLDGKDDVALELFKIVENYEHPGILCRLCGKPAADPVHLFVLKSETVEDEFNVADKINLCLPVTVTVTDPLPKQICQDCNVKLNVCHELAVSSLHAEDKLRLLLREKAFRVDANDEKCPLCVVGDMRIVKKSGVYRREDLKNDLCLEKADKTASSFVENLDDSPLRNNKQTPILPNFVFESTTTETILEARDAEENDPLSLPDGEYPYSILPSEEASKDDACTRGSNDISSNGENVLTKPGVREKRVTGAKERYTCHFCKKEFTRKGSLEKHIKALHGDSLKEPATPKCYKCKACCEAFAREIDAVAHARLKHPSYRANGDGKQSEYLVDQLIVTCLYVCEYCEHNFTMPSSVHEHRESEHAKNPKYSCATCDLQFESHRQLATHKTLRSHRRALDETGIKQFYVCKYCDKTFLHHSSHSNHVLRHRGIDRPYLCRICNLNFVDYREVSVHRDVAHPYQSNIHERSSLTYDCQYCRKQFGQEVALIKHIRMHTGERPYKCGICGKGFSQSSGLYTHLKTHSDLRPYSCTKCPRTFKIKGDRDNHIKKHAGNRPYKCEFCNKAFMTQHVYSQHCKIHTNERPYKCDICGQAFRRSHVLTVHIRRHTGEKPHVCDICPKSYRQRGDLLKHRRIHHGMSNVAKSLDTGEANVCEDDSFDHFGRTSKLVDIQANGDSVLWPL